MIDCIKVHDLPVIPDKLLNNKLLTFPLSNVATTGEALDRWQVAKYKTLTFGIKGNNSKLLGSMHKYRQNGENWQDFNLFGIQDTIKELSESFEFDPEKANINFTEIGINISLDYDPTTLINCLVIYRNTPFEKMRVTGKGYGKVAETENFDIKVYNKSLQYGLPQHLLRYEIKVKRMKFLERYGINGLTLADLTRPDIYPKFKTMLLDILSGILIYNPAIQPDKITTLQQDRELLKLGQFADYWQRLDHRRKSEKLIRFKELAGTNEIVESLKCKISDKWETLTNPDKITTLQDRNKQDKITTLQNENCKPGNNKTGQINTTIDCEFVHRCIVTGIDISMQKSKSKFLNNSGLRNLIENDRSIFDKLKDKRLSSRWENEQEKIQFKEIGHSCRNQHFNPKNNPRNNTKRAIKKILSEPALFDSMPFIRPEKMELAGMI